MTIYCVYLTTYKGNKLPPFYIGSSNLERVSGGYHGTVLSKTYKVIWRQELKHNPHLFTTKVVSTHHTRKEALLKERQLQQALCVVESPLYINKSYAAVDGKFGVRLVGNEHPLFGKQRTAETKHKISLNHANMRGPNNTNAKTIIVTAPNGERTACFGNFKEFCISNTLPYSTMNRILKQRIWPSSGPCVGYDVVLG